MEYHIKVGSAAVDLEAVQAALFELDPVAVASLDPDGALLRVSTDSGTAGLTDALLAAGCAVQSDQVLEVPPFCCGGCT